MSTHSLLAPTPPPPYYAVIFTSRRTEGDRGYDAMARRMAELAAQQPGFLGVESARGVDGLGITVSYWRDEASIVAWKRDTEHQAAQTAGKRTWYASYQVRVARVERVYGGPGAADRPSPSP
ncbi:MAG TPA: antibiotic biosynthesis monooxygenase [Lacunisphaera sp.]|nr:antibiotic biosynthesis monooxygenase [Lacunisphaera sp.]